MDLGDEVKQQDWYGNLESSLVTLQHPGCFHPEMACGQLASWKA